MEASKRVLVIDDQFSMRGILKRMLYQMGCFQCIEDVGDGEEAWKKLSIQVFDVVITDVKMPRLDGIELLKRCRAESELRELPFLFISGEALPELVAFAGEWGAYDFILKPFSYSLLKERVEGIFGRLRDPEETLYRDVVRLKENGYVDEALHRVDELERRSPSLKTKWLNLKGECLMEAGQMNQAATCIEQALRLSDVYLAAHKNYAAIQEKLGNVDKAIEALEKADNLSPMDTERKFVLGKLMVQTGRDEEAKKVLDKVLKLTPSRERQATRLKVAEVYLAKGLFAEAEELFVKALQADPSQIETYNRLGIALRKQGKLDEAEKYYKLALKNHPNNAAIHYNLGVLYLNRQMKDKARQLFQQALKIDPQLKKAEKMLSQMADAPMQE